jgi:hypothetical protein
MTRRNDKKKFWAILAVVNIAVMIYPVGLYVQADSNDKLFATIVLVGAAFLLALTDTVSTLVAYMQ